MWLKPLHLSLLIVRQLKLTVIDSSFPYIFLWSTHFYYCWLQRTEAETSHYNYGALAPMKKGLLIEEKKKNDGGLISETYMYTSQERLCYQILVRLEQLSRYPCL